MKRLCPRRVLALATVVVSAAACGDRAETANQQATAPPAPPAPVPPDGAKRPAPSDGEPAVVAVFSVADPRASWAAVERFGESVGIRPGDSPDEPQIRRALGGLVGLPELNGVSLARPIEVVVLDPARMARPIVIVATAEDQARIRASLGAAPGTLDIERMEGRRVAIGAKEALAAFGPDTLRSWPAAPASPTLVINVPSFLATIRPQIEEIERSGPPREGDISAASRAVAFLDQIARVTVTLAPGREALEVELTVEPKRSTWLAATTRGRKPSDFELLRQLPASGLEVDLIYAGNADRVVSTVLSEAWGPLTATEAHQLSEQCTETALLLDVGSGARWGMTVVSRLAPGADGRALVDAMLRGRVEERDLPPGTRARPRYRAKDFVYQGVAVSSLRIAYDYAQVPAEARQELQRVHGRETSVYAASRGDEILITAGRDAKTRMRELIDARKVPVRRLAAGAALEDAIARARREQASGLLFIAPTALAELGPRDGTAAPPPREGITALVLYPEGRMRLEVRVPAEAIAPMVRRIAPSAPSPTLPSR